MKCLRELQGLIEELPKDEAIRQLWQLAQRDHPDAQPSYVFMLPQR